MTQQNTEQFFRELLTGPKFPAKEYTRGGSSFAQVYALAADLLAFFAQTDSQEKPVCLAADDKAVIAAALLASLAGGPSLLLPYALSASSLARMQEVTGFQRAITDTERELPPGVQAVRPHRPSLTGEQEVKPLISPQTPISPQAELLKIFTGGSTGTPKVWSKSGENIFGEALFHAQRYRVSQRDCIMATVPPWHIYGLLFSVVLPLVSSATVLNATPSFPNEVVETAAKHQVTIFASVPAHYRVLREKELGLRLAFSSAGMLEENDNTAFCHHNAAGVIEVYGSTETGGIATRNRSQGQELFTPFSTIDWKIVLNCLAVRSPYISPDLPVDEQGFFLANDRAEATGTDGFLLKGRSDAVVKVGGKRVDLDEIAALIKKGSNVTDCLVTALPEPGGRSQRIAALLQGEGINKEQIKKTLEGSLEPYALPRLLKIVAALPVKQNGKYDWPAITRLLKNA
ncbi:MAG: AMP-binding protein [Candidatus Electrothrix sp. GW3-4]|uniref:AMP-binding protein n=1 Tax=Candidatus Electrothrix sp. GW3-4 TaxID=3126740 RepID=UPI0030D5A4C1